MENSSFVQVMKDWRRMCKTYTTDDDETCCAGCPIMALEYSEHGCDAIFSDWAESADWEEVEDIIETWAKEHPEPVYPLWFEWLEKIGVAGRAYELEPYFLGDKEIYMRTAAFTPKAFEPIPADIAEKLGIEPKEG